MHTGPPSVLPVCLIIMLDLTAMTAYMTLLPSWVLRYTESPHALAFMMAVGNIAIMIGMIVLGKYADLMGVRKTLRVSVSCMMMSLIATALASTYREMLAARAAMCFFAGTAALCKTYVLVAMPEDAVPKAILATAMSQTLSISIGPVAALLFSKVGLTCAQICILL